MLFLDNMDVSGKRLLIRVDYNVPLKDGVITDDNRIRQSLPTLKLALEKGAALVLCSHAGKPKGQRVDSLSLKPMAARVSELLGMDVATADDCIGPEAEAKAAALQPGQVLMLENLRFHEGETKNDPEFAKALAQMGQVFVNDAFGTAHRAHASVVGVIPHMQACCGGLLLKKEWEFIGQALKNPQRPYVAVSGGAKVSSKLGVLKSLLDVVDAMVIGGAMANTFFLAQGFTVGKSLAEPDLVGEAEAILKSAQAKGVDIHLPVDVTLGKGLDDASALGTAPVSAIPDDAMVLDVGPESAAKFGQALSNAKTIMWNGPMGAFENPAFAEGSLAVARAIAGLEGKALTVVGGGDTDAVIHKLHLQDKFSFISTGGGSFLEFLEGKPLPAFQALEECAK